jgi:3-isopropylmalate/(R)-2-methylmalate dehydratase small subunit
VAAATGGPGLTGESSELPQGAADMSKIIQGPVYVVGDNIDTDQIIPAQYLSLVPTIAEEYQRLGEYALCGLPREDYPTRLVDPAHPADYKIVVAGRNFGCGSSREHAPIALGAAGIEAVVAGSFARIFFRNCIATGEVYPIEAEDDLSAELRTGDFVEIDLATSRLRRSAAPRVFRLKPLGEAAKVIDAGGLFDYARKTGLVPNRGVAS